MKLITYNIKRKTNNIKLIKDLECKEKSLEHIVNGLEHKVKYLEHKVKGLSKK